MCIRDSSILLIASCAVLAVTGQEKPRESERPKVGVVLSGGSAKGFAHVGVLKVLERAGIPIDCIAGTSMGAVVGGLYSVGYGADAVSYTHLLRLNSHGGYKLFKVEREHLFNSHVAYRFRAQILEDYP